MLLRSVLSKKPTTRRSYSSGWASIATDVPRARNLPDLLLPAGSRVERAVGGPLGRLAALAVDEEDGARDSRDEALQRGGRQVVG